MSELAGGKVLALAGGVGGAKLALGLARILPPERLTIVVNTGDDEEFHGLHVSPDLDTMTYTLSGWYNQVTGWGVAGDSFETLADAESVGFGYVVQPGRPGLRDAHTADGVAASWDDAVGSYSGVDGKAGHRASDNSHERRPGADGAGDGYGHAVYAGVFREEPGGAGGEVDPVRRAPRMPNRRRGLRKPWSLRMRSCSARRIRT